MQNGDGPETTAAPETTVFPETTVAPETTVPETMFPDTGLQSAEDEYETEEWERGKNG